MLDLYTFQPAGASLRNCLNVSSEIPSPALAEAELAAVSEVVAALLFADAVVSLATALYVGHIEAYIWMLICALTFQLIVRSGHEY